MADSPSISSPTLGLSSKPSTVEEADANRIQAEVPPTVFQKMVAELVGTYVLVFMGCGAALVNKTHPLTTVGIAIVWGLVLMALTYAVGHVSGCHLNPAVTIALAAARKFPSKHVPMYALSQMMGATLASLTLRLLFQENIDLMVTQYSDSTTHLQALVWEFIATFILMFTICGVAADHRASKNLAGVAIGVTVLFNAMVAGPITGASMNPARSFGPAAVTGIYRNLWVYLIAPILGALAATALYSVLRVPEPMKADPKDKSLPPV